MAAMYTGNQLSTLCGNIKLFLSALEPSMDSESTLCEDTTNTISVEVDMCELEEVHLSDKEIEPTTIHEEAPTFSFSKKDSSTPSQKEKENQKHQLKVKRFLKICDVLVVAFSLFFIIGVFTIPTVFYALPSPTEQVQFKASINNSEACAEVQPYVGQACADSLMSIQTCLSGPSSSFSAPNIPSAIDQQQREEKVVRFLNGLPFLEPTQECSDSIRPFLCHHFFGLCDFKKFHMVKRQDCLRIREVVCPNVWTRALASLPAGTLPVCEDLDETDLECKTTAIMPSNATSEHPGTCSDGFFFDQNGTRLCRPECGLFEPTSRGLTIVERVSVFIGLVASSIMFILALTVQRNTLSTFPSVLLVYFCGTSFVLGTVVTAGFFDNTSLFCGSRDQIYAVGAGNETAYCTITGVIFYYCIEQMCMWAVFHATLLFWAMRFPFSYRKLQVSGRMHHVHIISVLSALILPVPFALIPLKDGYLISRNPTFVCVGRNSDYIYYTFILPASILLTIISCMFVLTFWIIFKAFVIKEVVAGRRVKAVGKAQLKIMVAFSYYTVMGTMGLGASTFFGHSDIGQRLGEHFICESTGSQDCGTDLDIYRNLSAMSAINFTLFFFSPVVALLFSLNPKAFCKKRNL